MCENCSTHDKHYPCCQSLTRCRIYAGLFLASIIATLGGCPGVPPPNAEEARDIPSLTWAKTLGTYGSDRPTDAIATVDGGFVVIGSIAARGSVVREKSINQLRYVTNDRGREAVAIKYDAAGNVIWVKGYGIETTLWADVDWAGVEMPYTGQTVIGEVEITLSSNNGSTAREYQSNWAGRFHYRRFLSVASSLTGDLAMGGFAAPPYDEDRLSSGSRHGWLVLTDAAGNIRWQATLNFDGRETTVVKVDIASNGLVYALGYTNNPSGVDDGFGTGTQWFVACFEADGALRWSRVRGNTSLGLWDLVSGPNGEVYITADRVEPFAFSLICLTPEGQTRFERTYPTGLRIRSIERVGDTLLGYDNGSLAAFDLDGQPLWAALSEQLDSGFSPNAFSAGADNVLRFTETGRDPFSIEGNEYSGAGTAIRSTALRLLNQPNVALGGLPLEPLFSRTYDTGASEGGVIAVESTDGGSLIVGTTSMTYDPRDYHSDATDRLAWPGMLSDDFYLLKVDQIGDLATNCPRSLGQPQPLVIEPIDFPEPMTADFVRLSSSTPTVTMRNWPTFVPWEAVESRQCIGVADADQDGVSDAEDGCPDTPFGDFVDALGCGCSQGLDSDGDGIVDCNDLCPQDPDKIDPGTCGCGVSDADTDADGTPDCIDDCPDNADKTEPGLCGCEASEGDRDSDGVSDCNDRCPDDSLKTEPGECGCGFSDVDLNGNGVFDCFDPNDDESEEQVPRTPQPEPGVVSGFLSFDGTDDLVNLGTLGDFGARLNTFTISIWVRTTNRDAVASLIKVIDRHDDNAPSIFDQLFAITLNREIVPSDEGYSFSETPGHMLVSLRDRDGKMMAASYDLDVSDEQWHHVQWVVQDASQNRHSLYIDGVLQPPTAEVGQQPANFAVFQQPVFVGTSNNRGDAEFYFDGDLDNLSIWTAALRAIDLESFASTPPPANAPKLVGAWYFDGLDGQEVADVNGVLDGKLGFDAASADDDPTRVMH